MPRYQEQRETPQSRKAAELAMALQVMQTMQGNQGQQGQQQQFALQAMLGMQRNENDSVQNEQLRGYQNSQLALQQQQADQLAEYNNARTGNEQQAQLMRIVESLSAQGKLNTEEGIATLQNIPGGGDRIAQGIGAGLDKTAQAEVLPDINRAYHPAKGTVANALAALNQTITDPRQRTAWNNAPWQEYNNKMFTDPVPGPPPSAHPDVPGYSTGEAINVSPEFSENVLNAIPNFLNWGSNVVRGKFGMEPIHRGNVSDLITALEASDYSQQVQRPLGGLQQTSSLPPSLQ